jgi:hypothetical protein
VCVTEAPPDEIVTVSWNPCTLGDDEGRSFEAWISWHDDVQTATTLSVRGSTYPVGTCQRGWIAFEVARNWRPDFVEYNPETGYPQVANQKCDRG